MCRARFLGNWRDNVAIAIVAHLISRRRSEARPRIHDDRDKVAREDVEAEPTRVRKETQESLEQNFTPSLARRLSRTLIEQTRRSLTRSPSASYEAAREANAGASLDASEAADRSISTVSDQTEYKARSCPRNRPVIRRTNSLLEASSATARNRSRRSPRRTVSLFDDADGDNDDDDGGGGGGGGDDNNEDDDDDESLYVRDYELENEKNARPDKFFSTYPRETSSSLGRWSKESSSRPSASKLRKDSFRSYRTDKIQEEPTDDAFAFNDRCETIVDNGSVSECTSTSVCDSNTNLLDATSSLSARSYETSPTESSSNIVDYKSTYKSDPTRNFENRLLAAENLIKESKLKNLGPASVGKFDPNLSSSYRDTDKCDKRSLISIAETTGAAASNVSKRRSCIPSLRLRSGSLTREPCTTGAGVDRRKSFAGSQHSSALAARTLSPEKSLLSKFFKTAANRENDSKEKEKEKTQKSMQRRISRFLRPDFFDTPREESRYVKEKEAQKAAENERRKSRFIRRKTENKVAVEGTTATEEGTTEEGSSIEKEKQREKELKNEINFLKRDRGTRIDSEESSREEKSKADTVSEEGTRNGFLHSLEKKLERLRSSNDEQTTTTTTTTTEEEKMANNMAKAAKAAKVAKPPATMNGRGVIANEATRERSAPPVDCCSSSSSSSFSSPKECATAKRASSVEDLSPSKKPSSQPPSKSRVSSVLGLFKTTDTKQVGNGTRAQPAILSKLKRSPTKTGKPASETNIGSEEPISPIVGSRIPTKLGNVDSKSTTTRKQSTTGDAKRPDSSKLPSESPKRSPPKEESKQDRASVAKENEKESAEKKSTGKVKKANRSSVENGGSATEPGKPEDVAEKKTRKLVKKSTEPSESTDSATDATKKKRIVRVVRKIAKKSSEPTSANNTEGDKTTQEEKGKCAKTRTKKKVEKVAEKSPEPNGKPKENGLESQANAKNSTRGETVVAAESKKSQESQRANRSSLKLDLSKIPQHSFRNTTPKKDSPKSDSPKNPVDSPNADLPDELLECLSKVTHRASIAGNKIVIDKPLRAKDVAELKREVTECARLIESHAESTGIPRPIEEEPPKVETTPIGLANPEPPPAPPPPSLPPKESSHDYTNDLLSPMDEPPESFDSWSVSSAELSHARPDLPSPTSPHSLSARNENSESVIDRIRRRSFYSRFNDRRRPSLTAPPPGVALSTSATLPRKFSFSGHREHRDRTRYGTTAGYGLSSKPSRYSVERNSSSYSLYGGDSSPILRNRSLDRGGRYSDIADLKSPTTEHVSLSSSYDPLRRYLRSPTFDLPASRTRYHSVDFTTADSDLTGYRASPLSSLLLNDTATIDPYHFAQPTPALGHGFSSSLPRKYGTVVGTPEPKTVEYYEELLAPSTGDYLPARRSPMSTDYLNRYENGYYNGNLELHSSAAKRKTYTEDSPSANGTACDNDDHDNDDDNDDEAAATARRRSKGDRVSETRYSAPTASTEAITTIDTPTITTATTTTRCTPDHG